VRLGISANANILIASVIPSVRRHKTMRRSPKDPPQFNFLRLQKKKKKKRKKQNKNEAE